MKIIAVCIELSDEESTNWICAHHVKRALVRDQITRMASDIVRPIAKTNGKLEVELRLKDGAYVDNFDVLEDE